MNFHWTFLIDLGIISIALLLGTLIRSKVSFFQKYLIPNSLTAGFILLIFYNWIGPLWGWTTVSLENMVFHFLNISFISMILRIGKKVKSDKKAVLSMATSLVAQYGLQCFVGTILTLIMIHTIFPSLFPGFGLFATLGFSLGPGQAFAIGSGWEDMGFEGLASVGLTFGALGFLLACFGGIFLINFGLRKKWIYPDHISGLEKATVRAGVIKRGEDAPDDTVENKTSSEAIDPLSFNAAIILGTYLLSYLLLRLLNWLLAFAGPLGAELAVNLWGIMFIFSAVTAMIVKHFIQVFNMEYVIDDKRMTRIAGFSVDFMVAASVGAISVAVLRDYWIPILIIAGVSGFITIVTHIWLSSRIFEDHSFYRAILIYGCVTGTLPTGLALLRIIDPEFETPASQDYMYASGMVFLMVIPIIITANMPAYGALKGSLVQTYIVLGIYAFYVLFCFVLYLFLSGKNRFNRPADLWLHQKHLKVKNK
ncbi:MULTISPECIES: sodium:glutamate symporter [unclassified Oceanispirochaeta]|uniref:sodium:glutamate symporter n=1 Tax=unclassified Oceanispirochaeta TaxID=2635722 RepID=UPI000E093139|nr:MULTISPECIES: sodium:glutamate symporter [unclassified Oceanispirochaeta]MBF9016460.1 sodium:glutamate symporter [Oceanispirochaeta sp. M2]NPD72922.1 sodium:glutamate symporter [Oceanispirochaeta sp. M1]RDG31499.1 sodium:glutamate symporter [Oceanispirochaeta sp. M1]